ncbi:hypothetical protein SAICODRAFT_7925 [Saitoella complicata NRRL Y-17804]|uniref:uncharacterized protein n=1 Tax=Saitoella complicata (strain BCRC 22490 / CBS 7301 / JCM 7358 / NBRC 10748 / NRRL Y-17804) TaxID=698492 RepID=UPI000867A2E6|nr:uncharacterized protein SAICODRAFT_7925 [Saitoella complicata NRRL Y-17804]ODQ52496.1 hypothetical protein SAICODRAFT_7925 [Saitoella complicata NRRL Y-17804]
MSDIDILHLGEDWTYPELAHLIEIPGFRLFHSPRVVRRHMRSTHGHGGSAVYVRNSLASEVKVLRLNGDSDRDWIWLAVCGVSCCFAYAPPPNSVAIVDEEDPLLTIYGEAAVYALSGPVVILGDLNARTGSLSTDLPSSKVLTFPGRRTRSAPLRVFTSRDAPPLEVVEEFEYVGVTVSATRAWSSKSHCRKAIAKARHTLFSLALVEPYLIYGVVVTFNGPFHAEYDMLHRTAMRIATGVSPRSITAPLFYDLAELPFFDRRTVLLAGYFDYLRALPPGRLAHEAFLSSQRLAEQGHRGWYSVARDRFQQLGIDLTQGEQIGPLSKTLARKGCILLIPTLYSVSIACLISAPASAPIPHPPHR